MSCHAEFPACGRRLSDDPRRHPLRHPLDQGERQGLKVDPAQVAIGGASSGGHLAMLVAMRPNDIALRGDPRPSRRRRQRQGASSCCGRSSTRCRANRNAIRRSAEPNPPAFTVGMKEKHDTYWHTEAEMAEGNPMLILERGEKVVMPPAIWVQGRPDEVHDYHDPDGGFRVTSPRGSSATTARPAATSKSPISTTRSATPT